MMLLMLGVVLAADWSPTTWAHLADNRGIVTLRAGEPLRLERPAVITEPDGREVLVRAAGDDWWIDPAPTTRFLVGPRDLRVQSIDPRQWNADWAAWEHDAALALASDEPVPLPPDGVHAVSRRLEARARAVGRRTALLGLLADVADHRGVSPLGRVAGRERRVVLEPGQTVDLEVTGAIRLGLRPMVDAFTRVDATVDGEHWPIASTGSSPVVRRFLRARGAAPLQVVGDAEVPLEVLVREDKLRLWAALPGIGRRPRGGLEAAEWDVLHGLDPDFSSWLDADDPAIAAWARVRQLERATGAELLTLADPAVPGPPAVAHAVLSRAADLPMDVPLAWLPLVERPDPRVLAQWLDAQPSSRPHGVAVFERARRGRPNSRHLASAQLRHTALYTRWAELSSDRDAEAEWRFAAVGTGVPRLQLPAGELAVFTATTADPSLREAVSWTAEPGTRFRLDDTEVVADGPLRLGLPAGRHTVEVEAGRLLVPRDRWEGGEPGVGWRAVPLPATFTLPGRGAPLELRLNTDGPVTLVFDDGRVVRADGARTLSAGPFATTVEVHGDGVVGIAARLVRVAAAQPEPLDVEGALERIRTTTAAIDDGDVRARARRAVALAMLGRRRLAWTDVELLADVDGALYRDTWAAVASLPVTTFQTGPLDAPTAAALGRPDEEAALAMLEANQRSEAVVLAAKTSNDGLLRRALAGMVWQPIQRMDSGNGLRPVELAAEVEERDLRGRVEDALIGSPWPAEETVVVREGAVDRITTPRQDLSLEVWCRDLTLHRDPCVLEAVGATTPGAVVSDGGISRIEVNGQQAEIGPVDEGQVVVVRATDRAGVLTAGVRRLALSVAGSSSVRLPNDRLVRFRVLQGTVDTTAERVAEVDGWTLVHPHGRLQLTGSGTVLVAVGREPEEDDTALELERPSRPRPSGLLTVDDVWPALDRTEHRTLAAGASTRVQLTGVVALDGQFRERWTTGELLAGVYQTRRGGWTFAEGWLRGPGGLGFAAEAGARRRRALASVRGFGATTLQGDAGEIGVLGHVRMETGPRWLWVRAELWPRAAWVSLQPRRTVDPKVWTRYRLTHFLGVDGRLSLLSEPTRDLRLRLYASAISNVGPSLDRVALGGRGDLLLRRHTRLFASSRLDVVFPDVDRPTGRLTPNAGLGIDHDWWGGDRRWMLFASGTTNTRRDLGVLLGLSVHGTRGRGLRDLPPTRDLFRTEREGRP